MTQPPTEPERGDPQAVPAPSRAPSRPPAWPYFLTPIAVLLGAAAIVVAIIVTDDDPQPPQEPVAPALEALSTSVESLTGAAEALSTAVESLAGAAESLSAAVETLSAAGRAEPGGTVTLRDALSGYAAALDLDVDSFNECIEVEATRDVVNDHLQRGVELGVNGTPTFFVNNKFISGAQPASVFLEVIAAELSGGPTSLDEYSDDIRRLAGTEPPRFAILSERPDIAGAATEGNPNARVVVVEFSDFQCPFCQRWYYDSLPEIRALAGDDVAIAFLHFPLTQIHPNAAGAHFAAECARVQGKFWEMHDLLFERQDEWAALPNIN